MSPRRNPVTLAGDWVPDQRTVAAIRTFAPELDINREVVSFTHYWTVGKGSGTRRANWETSFLNWCRKAAASSPAGPASARPARAAAPPRYMEDLRRWAETQDPT